LNPAQVVEAVLFASDAPLKAEEIARADESLDEDLIEDAIGELNAAYSESERAFEIRELGEGFQLLTRPEFATYLERFDTVPRPSRVSGPALETLAIIAYRQPIGRIEIEYIRGVSSAGVIRTLTDRALVDVVARGEGLGRPLLYGTTQRFLEHFDFRSLDDLPRPEELPVILRERAPLEEVIDEEPTEPDEIPVKVEEPGVEQVLAGEASGALASGEDVEEAGMDEMVTEDVEDPASD
jgi:segregation and condensation protein B